MQRGGLRGTFDGVVKDVPLGVFTTAAPVMTWNPVTNVFEGSAGGGGGAPSGPAGGQLSGTYPNPSVAGITTTTGPTALTIGAIANGEMLVRSGATVVGQTVPTSLPPNGAAGGQLGGTYPNPDVRGLRETSGPTALTLGAWAANTALTRVGATAVGSAANPDAHASRHNPGGADTLFTGTYAAGDLPEWSGTQWDPKFYADGFNTATQVLAVTALADVTNHTFALPRAGTYHFRFRGAYRSNAATTGLRFSAQYSGTSSSYNGALSVITGVAGAQEYFAQTTLNTAMGSGTGPGAADVVFEFWGRIVATSSGTFAFRIASEVAVASGITLAIGALSEITQL